MVRIEVRSFADQAPQQPLAAEFDELGGSIGRSDGNTLMLPDDKRYISRTQASVTFRAGSYVLRDLGSATPTLVNGTVLGNGNEMVLLGGEELRIGDYVLAVSLEAAPAAPDARPSDVVVSWEQSLSSEAEGEIKSVRLGSPHAAISPPAQAEDPAAQTAPPAPAVSPASCVAHDDAERDELLAAFLSGAGVPDMKVPGGMTPELMTLLGELMRESIAGTLDLLRARALSKREVRAQATVIVPRENNPLKFSPSVETALDHLLAPHGKDFMGPAGAMRDAYNDLRSHQFGFTAGMRAALQGVLGRFDPAQLEQRLAQKGLMGTLVPATRRLKLWELYEQLYREISGEAEDDFHTLFGKEFLRAYEAQVQKLKQEDATKR
ncbi:MAG TPA: type VI secretion system-associated FHA domain protein TagH [Burkholderiales bacterium]|nr:type VI secretion system-associated FHA domain protein TagH [Burkholderiales bacterium]